VERIGYGEHISNAVENMPYECVIQTEDIAKKLAAEFELPYDKAKVLTNVKLKRMADKGEIERVQRGVYCHIKQTVFGKVTPSIDEIVIKTLKIQDEKRIGYESGAFLLNRLGISTLMPRDIEITTNRYGAKLPEGCRIVTCKPAVTVTDENWKLLQFIDLVSELPNAHIDAENPEQLLRQYAKKQQIDTLMLIFTARKYYSPKVLIPLIDLFMEVEDEVTSG